MTEKNKNTTYQALMQEFMKQVNEDTRTNETDYTNALNALAKAIAHSVTKKCIDVSYNETLKQIKNEIETDFKLLSDTQNSVKRAYTSHYDNNGNYERVTDDKDAAYALKSLTSERLGDGIDLVHDAIVALLSEYNDMIKDRSELKNENWLSKKIVVRKLNKKIWIKKEDSKNAFHDVETTAIQECNRHVRRVIYNSKHIENANSYLYLDDIITDEVSNKTERIYRRLEKYADLGGCVTTYNNQFTTYYTADEQTVFDTDEKLTELNLSKQQSEIMTLRLRGWGYKAIATYLNLSLSTVKKQIQRIQEKATNINFVPSK